MVYSPYSGSIFSVLPIIKYRYRGECDARQRARPTGKQPNKVYSEMCGGMKI